MNKEHCPICGMILLNDEVIYTGEPSPFDIEPCDKCKIEVNARLTKAGWDAPWIVGKKNV